MKKEIWKDVPSYEGIYQVSNLGRVRSLDRVVRMIDGTSYLRNGVILKPRLTKKGYMQCSLHDNDRVLTQCVHQIVAKAFLNHIPQGNTVVIDHINGKKDDNRLENLQLVSQRQNLTKDRKTGSSKYPGVNWQGKKWQARIRINGKTINLGRFTNEDEAGLAYQKALSYYHCDIFI